MIRVVFKGQDDASDSSAIRRTRLSYAFLSLTNSSAASWKNIKERKSKEEALYWTHRVCRALNIWICQQRLNRSQNWADCIRRGPFRSNYVKANVSICINVGMEHLGGESNFRRLLRISIAKSEAHRIYSTWVYHKISASQIDQTWVYHTFPAGFRRAKNCGIPDENVVIVDRCSRSSLHKE